MAEAGDRAETLMRLIFTLRSGGVTDKAVLSAIERTPREAFVEKPFDGMAYDNTPLPISCGQTISQPTVVGLMTQALEVTPRCKVLEVGAGSGYQAAVLSRLARRVYAVERHRPLALTARTRIEALGLGNVTIRIGDGTLGWPEQAPFDRILVTAAADDTPPLLLEQLRVGGIMVLPVGQSHDVQQLIKIEKSADGLSYTELGEVLFVPLIQGLPEDAER
ncbi:MAG: protein-L-isoaspartate(D-aspartate) O-methyltransferase [Pseudomonadota bacterium]